MPLQTIPFQNIALSLSGGGYRASAFHLGSISYLEHVLWDGEPLARQIAILSTISGGTITGVFYALGKAEQRDFQNIFKNLHDFMREDTILQDAFALLNGKQAWQNPNKEKNLINAFAQVYSEKLFKDKTFSAFQNNVGLSDVMFNATDLENALPFRFQNSERSLFGNGKVVIPDELISLFSLGDITAASSCFPGAFEPMNMPGDFLFSAPSVVQGIRSIRLMDGGIVDNQAIESVRLAEERHARQNDGQPFIGTYLVSDVSTRTVQKAPKKAKSPWYAHFTIQAIWWFCLLSGLVALVSCYFVQSKVLTALLSAYTAVCTLILVLYYRLVRKALLFIQDTIEQQAPTFLLDLSVINRTKLGVLLSLVDMRLGSIGRLGNVFLQRIRSLQYSHLYYDVKWNYRIKSNMIYQLKKEDDRKSDANNKEGTFVSDELGNIIEQANQMGTTLWFSDVQKQSNPTMLDALVMAGQVTMCFNLIGYLGKIRTEHRDYFATLSPELQEKLERYKKQCLSDFDTFNKNPRWLLNIWLE